MFFHFLQHLYIYFIFHTIKYCFNTIFISSIKCISRIFFNNFVNVCTNFTFINLNSVICLIFLINDNFLFLSLTSELKAHQYFVLLKYLPSHLVEQMRKDIFSNRINNIIEDNCIESVLDN